MKISLSAIASTLAAAAMGLTGWFASNEAALANKVETLSTQQAAMTQQANDIDARLIRIENKLDALR